MEKGKYISLGNSIQIRQANDDTYTYYFNYRDKNDKNKVKRKKLFTSDVANDKNYKKALLMSENVINPEISEQEQKKIDEKYTLQYLKKYYFKKKLEKKHSDLVSLYSYIPEDELPENTNYKNKMQNVRKEETRIDKAFANSPIIDKDIRELTDDELETFFLTEIHSMTSKSKYAVHALCRAIVNFGLKKKIIKCNNPFVSIDLELKDVKRYRLKYLNKSQVAQLLNECRNYKRDPNVFNSVYLAILTAGRKATILNIRKSDFDFDTSTLTLHNLKTEKTYSVILNKEAINYFKNYLKDFDKDEYVIRPNDPLRRKKQAMRDVPKKVYKIMDEMFNKDLDKSNNKDRDHVVNFHSLRRTVATNLALDNVSIYKIMRLLSHTTTQQTQDYLNLSDLNMTNDIENTHSDFYQYMSSDNDMLQNTMSVIEYRKHLEEDNFSNTYDFDKQIENWRFKLESEHIDNLELEDFKTIEDLKHYLVHRNEFSSIEEYKEHI